MAKTQTPPVIPDHYPEEEMEKARQALLAGVSIDTVRGRLLPAALRESAAPADTGPRNVIEALARVERELPGIGKDQSASEQQGGYKYRGIEAITAQASVLLGKYGVVFVPKILSAEPHDLVVNGKPWVEWRVMVSYTVYGPGGPLDHVEVGPMFGLGRDNSDKGVNKALTQTFKYALLQVLCIGDKADEADGQTPETDRWGGEPPVPPAPTPEEKARADGWGSLAEALEARDKLPHIFDDLENVEAGRCLEALRTWRDAEGIFWPYSKANYQRIVDEALVLMENSGPDGSDGSPPPPQAPQTPATDPKVAKAQAELAEAIDRRKREDASPTGQLPVTDPDEDPF
jgi:hypothetical protein